MSKQIYACSCDIHLIRSAYSTQTFQKCFYMGRAVQARARRAHDLDYLKHAG